MRNIFLNLPVLNLKETIDFFESLGFQFKAEYTNETASAMIVEKNVFVMFFVESKFIELTKKDLINREKQSGHILSFSVDSKDDVNNFIENAVKLGGICDTQATDYGFVYQNSFIDINGYTWEVFWMNQE